MKLEEEVSEFIMACKNDRENISNELSDVILVCLNYAKHYNIDIEKQLNIKIKINENR